MEKRYEIDLAGKPLIISTGKLALQAGGAVLLRYGDTVVLGTATASKPRPGIDFFPLSVEFEERLYAAGRIPGSFFRREGRPTTGAILSARLTDRPLRPLFPKGYNDDTQIIITVLSVDMENPPDTLGTIAASAALTLSDIPFDGPVASVRLGCINGELVVQPTFSQLAASTLNLVVAGTRDAIMMVEADAREVPEDLLVRALELGQAAIRPLVDLQDQMRAAAGRPKRAYLPATVDEAAVARVDARVGAALRAALAPASGLSKQAREATIAQLRVQAADGAADAAAAAALSSAFAALESRVMRSAILERGERPDGRVPTQVRPLSAEVGLIPRTHGSGLFQRGETQVLALTTLAGTGMVQRLDDLTPLSTKRFLHHYNFPPFSVGETGRVGGPGRREVGHGMLGERALQAVLPEGEVFPYTIRVVSEVLGSNGSTSMASICAAVLSMMDAGVPLKAPLAGTAMGLIKGEGGRFQVLTDIAGIEDHLGDMDFKVAGTRTGVCALQMDIKVAGITPAIVAQALQQAKAARLEILDVMESVLPAPRAEMSPFAPRMVRVDIPTDKIGAIIGPGGKTIRALEEQSGASIDIEENGSVFVTGVSAESVRKAVDAIRGLTKDVEPGEIYTGKVTRLMNFGAFVEILPGKDALVHISELADYRVPSVEDVVQVGDEIMVMVTEIDNMGRINASRRAVLTGETGPRPDGGGGGGRGRGGDRGGRGDRGAPRGRGEREAPAGSGEQRERTDAGRSEPREQPGRAERRDRPAPAGAEDRPRPGGPRAMLATEPLPAVPSAPMTTAPSSQARAAVAPAEPQLDAEEQAGGQRRRRRRRSGRSSPGGPTGPSGFNGPSSPNGPSGPGSPRFPRAPAASRAAAEEEFERQPDNNLGTRGRSRSLLNRALGRRTPRLDDDGPAPPPPPRPDFGAPAR